MNTIIMMCFILVPRMFLIEKELQGICNDNLPKTSINEIFGHFLATFENILATFGAFLATFVKNIWPLVKKASGNPDIPLVNRDSLTSLKSSSGS